MFGHIANDLRSKGLAAQPGLLRDGYRRLRVSRRGLSGSLPQGCLVLNGGAAVGG